MTFKRQWMLVLVLSVALSVLVNSIVFGLLINRYFVDYSQENYDSHVSQVVTFATEALSGREYTRQQLEMQLESHLSDPISRIRLYNSDGNLLADVGAQAYPAMGSMRGDMMRRMLPSSGEEVDSIEIQQDGTVLGRLNISRYSSIGSSLSTRRFLSSLIGNSLLSFGIVFALIFVLGYFISKRMSRDLTQTAQQAVDIDLGRENRAPLSHVSEIKTIQQSLEALQSRLKLKQASRKQLIDELVHQTRTPLTILKTHLEGFSDGVIRFTPEEVKTCDAQIENLTSIIANMSGLIDAEREIDTVNIEQIELSALIKQIIAGLKAQFDKKGVALTAATQKKIVVRTDPYKLSQAVYNLLTNAYKFTGSGGSVSVDYRLEGGAISISVRDTGAGIPADEQQQIFDAYYRGRNSAHTSGDGIGLYIVKENLRKIGGSVGLQSKPGEGSTFILRIPVEYAEKPEY
jgi:signal transduction histidine kinase